MYGFAPAAGRDAPITARVTPAAGHVPEICRRAEPRLRRPPVPTGRGPLLAFLAASFRLHGPTARIS
jgi:hypothetical protein